MSKRYMLAQMLALSAFSGLGNGSFNFKDELDGIDIKEEYEKIQQKKSALSRRQRELVISKYERLKGGK